MIEQKNKAVTNLSRGIRIRDLDSYSLRPNTKFKCILTHEEIPFDRVNDNYCDCVDGSDETATNACPNGKFYCKFQKRFLANTN